MYATSTFEILCSAFDIQFSSCYAKSSDFGVQKYLEFFQKLLNQLNTMIGFC